MNKVPAAKVATAIEDPESPLPPKVQEALGELVGAAKEGLLALSVGVGLSVVHEWSSVSEMFRERTATALAELMSRRLDDVRLAVMMLDGMEVAERTHVVALGITTEA